jgi:hypothetical protein
MRGVIYSARNNRHSTQDNSRIYLIRELFITGEPVTIDFRTVNLDAADFWPYGAFIDNAGGTEDLSIYFPEIEYEIVVPAGEYVQRNYPGTKPQTAIISGAGNLVIAFANFPLSNDLADSLPPVPNPLWPYTILQVPFDGNNGAIDFVDVSPSAHTLLNINPANTYLDTAVKQFGTASLKRTSNAGGIQVLGSLSDFTLGTGDVTVEGWLNISTFGLTTFYQGGASNASAPLIYLTASDIIYYGNGAHGMTTNAQYHTAWCRAAGVSRLFVGGIQRGPDYVDGLNYGSQTLNYLGISATGGLFGHLDEMRILKGIGLYTSNFIPPTQPFPLEYL